MRKEAWVFVVVLLLFFVIVFAEESSNTETIIGIDGCTDDDENFAKIGNCLGANAYCDSQNNPLDSFTEPNACTKGVEPGSGYSGDTCCTIGVGGDSGCEARCINGDETCNTNEKGYYCIAAVKDCSEFESKGKCLNNDSTFDDEGAKIGQCYWNNNKDICIPFSKGCYDYTDPTDCGNDVQSVARDDTNCNKGEFKVGENPYVVRRDSCECVWVDLDGTPGSGDEKCGLNYSIITGFGAREFSSCLYVFNLTEKCEEGDQGFERYTYVSNYTNNSGEEPSDFGCADRNGQRRCGVPVVKVPFFDFTNVVLVMLLIFVVYYFRSKFSFWYK